MIVSIVIIVIGLINLVVAWRFKAPWLSGGSVFLATCGLLLLGIQLRYVPTPLPVLFAVFGMLALSMVFTFTSIFKREIRVSLNP